LIGFNGILAGNHWEKLLFWAIQADLIWLTCVARELQREALEKAGMRAMRLARANGSLDVSDLPPDEVIFGQSPQMAIVRSKLERVADTNVPVLIQGDCGTGKEILAKLFHARSDRSNAPFIKVICPAIPGTLIESELFGYEKGAFTGAYASKRGRVELAHQGTLFLDEIGSLDLGVQAKLLQLLQDGSFVRVGGQEPKRINARIVSAANGNLRERAEEGSFRLDFFYRINAVTIDLPPLRHRIEDLPVLIDYFFAVHSKALHCEPRPLSREMRRLMQKFNWPGNIRQLENLIRSYILIGSEEALAAELVPTAAGDLAPEIDLANPISLKQITKDATHNLEQQIILKVLRANGWSRQKTAKWLNISYRSLLYKLEGSPVLASVAASRSGRVGLDQGTVADESELGAERELD
jgi:two-component system response regulator AtoC